MRAPTIAPPASPFKGLAAFEDSELDALFFFGRERECEVIVANLLASRLTLLYGESGVGKSSLLAAGVARELRALDPSAVVALHQTWSGPFEGTLDDVRDAEEGYLLLDQFEEYFLYHGDDDSPGMLLRELPELLRATRVNVLLSLREDALAELDAFKARIPGVFANQYRLEHLDRDAGRTAILGPISRWNELADEPVDIEADLVEAVLDEVASGRIEGRAHNRDRIEAPYLQLVLERIWETERTAGSSVLRLETLRSLGGAASIVRNHLHDALAALTPGEQDVAAEMFEHLVTPSGTKIAHRAADLAQYAHVPESTLRQVLSGLTRERIVHSVDGSDRYEIFHDVLTEPIQAWRQERRLQRERRAAHRRQRRLLVFAVAVAAALAVVTAIALFALAQRSNARSEAQHARAGEFAATALAMLDRDPVRSLQQALSAARIERSPRVADVLRASLLESRVRLVLPAQGAATAASFSPDSRRVVVGDAGGRVVVRGAKTARVLRILHVGGPVVAASWSHDGRLLAAGRGGRALVYGGGAPLTLRQRGLRDAVFGDGDREIATAGGSTADVWDAGRGRLLATFAPGGTVTRVALSPDGTRLAAAWSGPGGVDHVALYDERTGHLVNDLRGTIVLFSHGGGLLATGDPDELARVYRSSDGELVARLAHGAAVTAVDFRQDDRRIVTASADGAVRVWDVASGTRLLLMPSGTTTVRSARYSGDGKYIVTGDTEGLAHVWNAQNSRELLTLRGHRDAVDDAGFDGRGRFVITASDDGTARIWDTLLADQLRVLGRSHGPVVHAGFASGGAEIFAAWNTGAVRAWRGAHPIAALHTHAPLAEAASSPSGAFVATVSEDGTAELWRTRSGQAVLRIHVPAPGRSVSFDGSGRTLLVAGGRVLRLVDVAGRRQVRSLQLPGVVTDARFGGGDAFAGGTANGRVLAWASRGAQARAFDAGPTRITRVAISPDGTRVAAASRDRRARIWSIVTGRLQHALKPARTPLTDAEFSGDGRFLATGAVGGDVRIWTVEGGVLVHVLRGHVGRVARVRFSPNDEWILTAGPTSAGLWRTSTGRLLLYLRGHTGQVEDALFAPDDKHVVTWSADGTVRTYTCVLCGSVYELARLARVRLSHLAAPLTSRERKRYLGG